MSRYESVSCHRLGLKLSFLWLCRLIQRERHPKSVIFVDFKFMGLISCLDLLVAHFVQIFMLFSLFQESHD